MFLPVHKKLYNNSSMKDIVFTLRDGKIILTPESAEASLSNSSLQENIHFQQDSRELNTQEEVEVYIEIFRENSPNRDQASVEDETINNISSAYEAFWKGNFSSCLERRTCVKCGQPFLTPQQLFNHFQQSHQILSPEECFICHILLPDGLDTIKHLQQIHHITKPDFTCEVCFLVLNNEAEKNTHRHMHSASKKCKWCSESFQCKFLLAKHLQQCLLQKTDEACHICGCHFMSRQILQLHSLRHNRIACDICNVSLHALCGNSSEESMEVVYIKHLKNEHTTNEINKIIQVLKKQDEEEEMLDRLFVAQVESNLPQLNVTDTASDRQLDQETKSDQAMSFVHEIDDTNQESLETNFQCSECPKSFKTKEEVTIHYLDHQTPFSCDVCKISFCHRRGFKKHMRSHGIRVKLDANRWYKCKQCSVQCASLSALRIHVLTHTEYKPILCDKCGLRFRRPQGLRMHEDSVHKSKAIHSCPECGTSSQSKKSLLRHMQCVHAGVRRFICGLCSMRFLQNQDLRRHLKTTHNLELPPLCYLSKKSNSEIHVIPPPDNLSPTDPLSDLLKSAVREEQLKLEIFRKKESENLLNGETRLSNRELSSESYVDGQPLTILRDVASKAAPLEQTSCSSEALQQHLNSNIDQNTHLLCGGCHYVSDNVIEFSSHINYCQQGRTSCLSDEVKTADFVSSDKNSVTYPLISSLPSITTNNQYCLMPTQPITSSSFQMVSGTSLGDSSLLCPMLPTLNIGMNTCQPVASTASGLVSNLMCTGETSDINIIKESESTFSGHEPTIGSLSLENSQILSRLEEVNAVSSSNQPESIAMVPSTFSYHKDFSNKEECILEECGSNYSLSSSLVSFANKSHESHDSYLVFREEVPNELKSMDINSPIYENTRTSHPAPQNDKKSASDVASTEIVLLPTSSQILSISKDDISLSNPVPNNGDTNHESSDTRSTLATASNKLSLDDPSAGLFPFEESPVCGNSVKNPQLTTEKDIRQRHSSLSEGSNPLPERHIFSNSNASTHQNLSSEPEKVENGLKTCPECGKQLSCATNLKRHLLIHFGGKPHECLYCGKCFRFKHNLTVHIRSHTGSRPYGCTICKKQFRYHPELKEHILIHEKSKVFSCSVCNQYFSRQRDLKRHSASHNSDDKPSCPICKKQFCRMDYLKMHIKSHRMVEESKNVQETCRPPSKTMISSSSISKSTRKANVIPGNSEDLISLAFQAAEDGVEFMFVEEVEKLEGDHDSTENPGSSKHINYVQIIHPAA